MIGNSAPLGALYHFQTYPSEPYNFKKPLTSAGRACLWPGPDSNKGRQSGLSFLSPLALLITMLIQELYRSVRDSVRDLLPIVIVIGLFQGLVLRQPIPHLEQIALGALMIVLGLTLFVRGLEMALFPIGEVLAYGLARKGSVLWLMVFSFALGFGTTVAEPALIAIADQAAEIAAGGNVIPSTEEARQSYAFGLRLTVALSVGLAVVIGVFRILKGWPIQWFIIAGYMGVVIMTAFAPPPIIGIAYDSGGVTTSTVTVPLLTALGVGLAQTIRGRNPMIDGFGLIAFASLTPMIFVMVYGMVVHG